MAKKNTYVKKKSLGLRIFICVIAVTLLLGIVIMPALVNAEESGENVTVPSFETGKLSDALYEAADGTDYNYIKNVAVMSGTLSASDYNALQAIPNLEILELADTDTEDGIIPENALPSRNQLALVTLPKNTVEIGKNAFSGNKKLVKVVMPSTVTKIDDFAFAYCEALKEIPVSEAVTYIGESAFQDCKAINEFVIPAGITEIYPNTFSKCGFESISIGPNVTKIGASVFADCNNLKDIYAYGKTAPSLDGDVFRNVGATIHCYEDSEDSYQSWSGSNINIAADLTGEYELEAVVPEENNEAYEAADETVASSETEAESVSETASETSATETVRTDEGSEKSGGLSVGVVIVIVIMAVIIAVLATILVMTRKGSNKL